MTKKTIIWALVGMMLLGAVFRFYDLGDKSLWLDEAVLYNIAVGTHAEVLEKNAQFNAAPPAYALIISVVEDLNDSEAGLRSVSAMAGVLVIPALFGMTRAWTDNTQAALLAAFIYTVSARHVIFAQQLREYTLVTLVAVLALWFIHEVITRRQVWLWLPLGLLGAFGIMLHYGLALFVLGLNIVFIATAKRQKWGGKHLIGWVGANLLMVGAVLYVIDTALGEQFVTTGFGNESYLGDSYWDGSPRSLAVVLFLQSYWLLELQTMSPGLFIALVFTGVYAGLRQYRGVLVVQAVLVAVTMGAALLSLFPYIGIHGRQTIYLTPMLFALAGGGGAFLLAHLPQRAALVVMAIVFFAVFSPEWIRLDNYYQSEGSQHARPVIARLKEDVTDEDMIYVGCRGHWAFNYYYRDPSAEVVVAPRQNPAIDKLRAHEGRKWLFFVSCADEALGNYFEAIRPYYTPELVSRASGVWLYVIEPTQ